MVYPGYSAPASDDGYDPRNREYDNIYYDDDEEEYDENDVDYEDYEYTMKPLDYGNPMYSGSLCSPDEFVCSNQVHVRQQIDSIITRVIKMGLAIKGNVNVRKTTRYLQL